MRSASLSMFLCGAVAAQPDAAPGGAATVVDATLNAFGQPAPTLDASARRAFLVGNSFFKQNWVVAPSSTPGRDGLGPLFNARSCSSCHLRDGRSRPPEGDEPDRHGVLVRIGVRRAGESDAPHPVYGGQIQDLAIPGARPEASVQLTWREQPGAFADGTPFTLLAPELALADLNYGPLGDAVTLGARVAPQLIGLGLLEAIPAESLAAAADPDDRDGDGISGRVHWLTIAGQRVPGRFGWKATQPDVAAQTAAAFVNDMGITSRSAPREVLTGAQRASMNQPEPDLPSAAEPEIADAAFARVVFYTRTLAVPAQRGSEHADVRAGAELFTHLGCAACHTPQWRTGASATVPGYRSQAIRPYTDLLLHDLGPGLADGKHDGDARPQEWRTPPLWGIGLFATVNGHTRYLHDGRARSLEEAVLWHGGEAEAAKERYRAAPADVRAQLLAFLQSL